MTNMFTIDDITKMTLPVFHDRRGSLSFAEAEEMIPFAVKRMFWIYGVHQGATRGGHAHKHCKQAIVALQGSFSLYLTDLEKEMTLKMDTPYNMVVVPEGIWCELKDFSADAVVLVATSDHFDKDDYLQPMREYEEWKKTGNMKGGLIEKQILQNGG